MDVSVFDIDVGIRPWNPCQLCWGGVVGTNHAGRRPGFMAKGRTRLALRSGGVTINPKWIVSELGWP